MSEFDPPADAEKRLKDMARTSWTFGLIAIILAMLSPCSYWVILIAALPLGIMATMRAREVLAAPERDPVSEIYAKTGNITGLAATIYSIVFLTIIGSFILMYAGIFAMVILGEM